MASTLITWITDHLPTQKGWKAELAWLVNPQRTPYPQVVTCQPLIRRRSGKVRQS